jgi:hypothetical protein
VLAKVTYGYGGRRLLIAPLRYLGSFEVPEKKRVPMRGCGMEMPFNFEQSADAKTGQTQYSMRFGVFSIFASTGHSIFYCQLPTLLGLYDIK